MEASQQPGNCDNDDNHDGINDDHDQIDNNDDDNPGDYDHCQTCPSLPKCSWVFMLYETASTLKITSKDKKAIITAFLIKSSVTFGSICENLSRTPDTPKSGEVELQTAPGDVNDEG